MARVDALQRELDDLKAQQHDLTVRDDLKAQIARLRNQLGHTDEGGAPLDFTELAVNMRAQQTQGCLVAIGLWVAIGAILVGFGTTSGGTFEGVMVRVAVTLLGIAFLVYIMRRSRQWLPFVCGTCDRKLGAQAIRVILRTRHCPQCGAAYRHVPGSGSHRKASSSVR